MIDILNWHHWNEIQKVLTLCSDIVVASLKLQCMTKGLRHSPLFRKGHRVTPLSLLIKSPPQKSMLSYFHGKVLRWSFATLKRRRGVHVRKGCLVRKVKKCHSFNFLTEESPVFLSLIVDLQEAGHIADKKLSRFVLQKQ